MQLEAPHLIRIVLNSFNDDTVINNYTRYSITGQPFGYTRTFSNLAAGTYTANLHDDHNCIVTAFNFTVYQSYPILQCIKIPLFLTSLDHLL